MSDFSALTGMLSGPAAFPFLSCLMAFLISSLVGGVSFIGRSVSAGSMSGGFVVLVYSRARRSVLPICSSICFCIFCLCLGFLCSCSTVVDGHLLVLPLLNLGQSVYRDPLFVLLHLGANHFLACRCYCFLKHTAHRLVIYCLILPYNH